MRRLQLRRPIVIWNGRQRASVLNSTLDHWHWRDNQTAASPTYLVHAKSVVANYVPLLLSNEAVLPCGDVFNGHVVLLDGGCEAGVIDFWCEPEAHSTDIYARLHLFNKGDAPLRVTHTGTFSFVSVNSIIEPIAWYTVDATSITVAMPLWAWRRSFVCVHNQKW